MLPLLTAPTGGGIIDEINLDVLNHDVPIGGDHRECCADVSAEILLASPRFLAWFLAPRSNPGLAINMQDTLSDRVSEADITMGNLGFASMGFRF